MLNRRIHTQQNPGSDTDENSDPGSSPADAVSLKKRLLIRGFFVQQPNCTRNDCGANVMVVTTQHAWSLCDARYRQRNGICFAGGHCPRRACLCRGAHRHARRSACTTGQMVYANRKLIGTRQDSFQPLTRSTPHHFNNQPNKSRFVASRETDEMLSTSGMSFGQTSMQFCDLPQS